LDPASVLDGSHFKVLTTLSTPVAYLEDCPDLIKIVRAPIDWSKVTLTKVKKPAAQSKFQEFEAIESELQFDSVSGDVGFQLSISSYQFVSPRFAVGIVCFGVFSLNDLYDANGDDFQFNPYGFSLTSMDSDATDETDDESNELDCVTVLNFQSYSEVVPSCVDNLNSILRLNNLSPDGVVSNFLSMAQKLMISKFDSGYLVGVDPQMSNYDGVGIDDSNFARVPLRGSLLASAEKDHCDKRDFVPRFSGKLLIRRFSEGEYIVQFKLVRGLNYKIFVSSHDIVALSTIIEDFCWMLSGHSVQLIYDNLDTFEMFDFDWLDMIANPREICVAYRGEVDEVVYSDTHLMFNAMHEMDNEVYLDRSLECQRSMDAEFAVLLNRRAVIFMTSPTEYSFHYTEVDLDEYDELLQFVRFSRLDLSDYLYHVDHPLEIYRFGHEPIILGPELTIKLSHSE